MLITIFQVSQGSFFYPLIGNFPFLRDKFSYSLCFLDKWKFFHPRVEGIWSERYFWLLNNFSIEIFFTHKHFFAPCYYTKYITITFRVSRNIYTYHKVINIFVFVKDFIVINKNLNKQSFRLFFVKITRSHFYYLYHLTNINWLFLITFYKRQFLVIMFQILLKIEYLTGFKY